MPKDQYMCQLCANHGIFNQPKKGHKQKCPYKTCECNLCALNTKRRTLDQIERQLKNTSGPADFDPHQKGSSSYAGLTINKNMETPSTTGESSRLSPLGLFKVPPQPSPATKPAHYNSNLDPSSSKGSQMNNNNNNNDSIMSIALPTTLFKKPVFTKCLPVQYLKPISPYADPNIKRQRTNYSIFHSAEKLAQSG